MDTAATLNYVLAPPEWRYDMPNPFSGAAFDRDWSGLFFLDRDDAQFINGTGPNGLYCVRLGRRTPHLEYRVADFLRYESAQGRQTVVGSEYAFDIPGFIQQCLLHTPTPSTIRDTDPRYIVHSTSLQAWQSIRTDLTLRSPHNLRKNGIAYTSIGFRELREPPEYEYYIHFGSVRAWHSEAIVLSQQRGKICTEEDAIYTPGVRIYLDNHRLIRDDIGIRDGLHTIKAKSRLHLSPYMVAAISVADLDSGGAVKQWTPRRFFEAANEHFYRQLPETGPGSDVDA